MTTFVLRLWLPDRPGALGAVASRVGAVGGDVVGIEILERGAGRAVDEVVVDLPDEGLVDLLVSEVHQVDGVDVEQITHIGDSLRDPLLDAFDTAAILVGARTPIAAVDGLAEHARRTVGTAWSAVVALDDGTVVAERGDAPGAAWLVAFVEGSRTAGVAGDGARGADDVVWAPLPAARMALVVGREGAPFRARERRHVAALARIVDTRFRELRVARSQAAHPTGGGRS